MRITRLAGLTLGAALVFLPAGPASADPLLNCTAPLAAVCQLVDSETGGQCNAVDLNCEYCSQNGSSSASSNYHCDDNESGYEWIGCTVWTGTCVVG